VLPRASPGGSVPDLHPADLDAFAARERAGIVAFWKTDCSACLHLLPVLDRLAQDPAFAPRLAKVNVADHPSAGAAWRIPGTPTLLFFRGGKEVFRLQGGTSERDLRAYARAKLG
jgi:thioredoxin 1